MLRLMYHETTDGKLQCSLCLSEYVETVVFGNRLRLIGATMWLYVDQCNGRSFLIVMSGRFKHIKWNDLKNNSNE